MGDRFGDAGHLVRLVLLFVVGILVFVVARAVFVPADFGELGHYRAGALADIRARPPLYAGRAACAACHAEVAKAKAAGKHARVGCESCHGPLGAHAAAPKSARAERPAAVPLCSRCHTANQAKPKGFPQVDPPEHSQGAACIECHNPHAPSLG